MSLATSFLALVGKAVRDVDWDSVARHAEALAASRPDLRRREVARLLVERSARRAAFLGAAASLPPGWFALAATGPEITALVALQSRMILGLHALWGEVPEPGERAAEVLAGLATGAGVTAGRRAGALAAEAIARRLVLRLAGREASHLVPVLGVAAGAALNYAAVKAVGLAAMARLERRLGPPGAPGAGPVLDVPGRVA